MSVEIFRAIKREVIQYQENVLHHCMMLMNSFPESDNIGRTLVANTRRVFELSCRFIPGTTRENMPNELEFQIKFIMIALDIPPQYPELMRVVQPFKDEYLAKLHGWYIMMTNYEFQLEWQPIPDTHFQNSVPGTLPFELLDSVNHQWKGPLAITFSHNHSACIHEVKTTKTKFFNFVRESIPTQPAANFNPSTWQAIYRLTDILFTISSYPQTRCS